MGCASSSGYGDDVRRGGAGARKGSAKPVRFGPRNAARAGALAFPTQDIDALAGGGARGGGGGAARATAYGDVEGGFYARGAAAGGKSQRAVKGGSREFRDTFATVDASRRGTYAARRGEDEFYGRQRPRKDRREDPESFEDDLDDEEVDVPPSYAGGTYGAPAPSGASRLKSKLRARASMGRRKSQGAAQLALAPSMMQQPEFEDVDPWERLEWDATPRQRGGGGSRSRAQQDPKQAPLPPPALHRTPPPAPPRKPSAPGEAVRKSLSRVKKQLQSPAAPKTASSPYGKSLRSRGDDVYYDDDASSVSVCSSERTLSRRHAPQSPPSGRATSDKPWLHKQTNQSGLPRFSSDTPVGRSWDRIQAVAARKSGDSEQYRSPYYR